MTAAIRDAVVSMVLASLVLCAAMVVLRAVGYLRLHHPLANRRYRRRYRAEHALRAVPGARVEAGNTDRAYRWVAPHACQQNHQRKKACHEPDTATR